MLCRPPAVIVGDMRSFLPVAIALFSLVPAPPSRAEPSRWAGGPAAASAAPTTPEVRPRHRPPDLSGPTRCTPDGAHCISLDSYTTDVCGLISTAAERAGLDKGFFARLLWRESLFDAGAISPAGAQGIAQFMPQTAALRGLEDPFNPAEAIVASADYLADLARQFGNLGLAAAAYNGGENRMERFTTQEGVILPRETIDYVSAITGHPVEAWRDAPPEEVDYRLDGDTPFLEACLTQAEGRSIRQFRDPTPPWGVVVAAGRRQATAEGFAARVKRENPGVLGGREIRIVQATIPRFGNGRQYTAQVPAQSQAEALSICKRLRSTGGFCVVSRN